MRIFYVFNFRANRQVQQSVFVIVVFVAVHMQCNAVTIITINSTQKILSNAQTDKVELNEQLLRNN